MTRFARKKLLSIRYSTHVLYHLNIVGIFHVSNNDQPLWRILCEYEDRYKYKQHRMKLKQAQVAILGRAMWGLINLGVEFSYIDMNNNNTYIHPSTISSDLKRIGYRICTLFS